MQPKLIAERTCHANCSLSVSSSELRMSVLPSASSKEAPMVLAQQQEPGEGMEEGTPMAGLGDDAAAAEDTGGVESPVAQGGASELSSMFNLSNSILGSGTLAMPYACHQCGCVMFLVLLVVVGLIANFSLNLLVISLEENAGPAHMSYGVLAEKVIGRNYQKAASWAVIIQQLGACVAYIVIIADVLQPIFGLSATSPDSVLCDRSLVRVLMTQLQQRPALSIHLLSYACPALVLRIAAPGVFVSSPVRGGVDRVPT
jgi:hypothetical protein